MFSLYNFLLSKSELNYFWWFNIVYIFCIIYTLLYFLIFIIRQIYLYICRNLNTWFVYIEITIFFFNYYIFSFLIGKFYFFHNFLLFKLIFIASIFKLVYYIGLIIKLFFTFTYYLSSYYLVYLYSYFKQ